MKEQKCYELLGLNFGNPDTEMTAESLSIAIVRSIESRLSDTTAGMEQFTVVEFLDNLCFRLLQNEDDVLFLATDEDENDDFDTCEDATLLFYLLSAEKLLHEIICEPIVTELNRLLSELDESGLAEYETIKL